MMKRLASFIITFALCAAALPQTASAQPLPDVVMLGVAQIVAYTSKPFNQQSRIKQGSGIFVDNGGCLYTNAHVALNLDTDKVEPHLVVNVTQNRAEEPSFLFEAELIYVDQNLDMAYLCPIEDTGAYTLFFERFREPMFEKRQFGDDVWVMGFPAAGEGTITISPGHIIGFLQNPDLSQWLGTPELDGSKLKIYKTDALSGPGVSGGVMVDKDMRLVGVPFAGTLLPGGFIFTLAEDVYLRFEHDLRTYLHASNLVPSDCVYDEGSGYYQRAGQKFYDQQCRWDEDKNMETVMKQMYASFCGKDMSVHHLVPAVRRSKELGDLAKWSDAVTKMCPGKDAAPQSQSEPAMVSNTAQKRIYGQEILPFRQEARKSVELKRALSKSGIKKRVSKDLVNAYVYGGYPLEAIARAVNGEATVHPTKPFSSF